MLRKLLSKLIVYAIPQLKSIINKEVSYFNVENIEDNVHRHTLTKILEPYRIFNVTIKKGTYVSVNSKISNTSIGKFCSVGPNFLCGWGLHPTNGLSTNPFFYSTAKQNGGTIADKDLFEERKPITIGNDVFIGANVTVLDGVTIGDGAIIGAGAIVSKNIPDYAIAYGNPIEIKKMRFDDLQRKQLKEIEWWNFDDDKLKDINTYFYNIDAFIKKHSNE